MFGVCKNKKGIMSWVYKFEPIERQELYPEGILSAILIEQFQQCNKVENSIYKTIWTIIPPRYPYPCKFCSQQAFVPSSILLPRQSFTQTSVPLLFLTQC